MDLTDKKQLIEYLQKNGLYTKHSLGQNFLVDRDALEKIVEAAEIKPDELIIEVGPGVGTLTTELVKFARDVLAIEIDEKLAKLLISNFKFLNSDSVCHPEPMKSSIQDPDQIDNSYNSLKELDSGSPAAVRNDNLRILNSDILKVNIPELVDDRVYKVVANIPYYITSKIIRIFLTTRKKPESIVVLTQKEVAERICAKPGDMSVLSVSVQAYGEPEIVGIVPRDSFFPAPNVDSAILRIKIFNSQYSIFNQFSIFNFQSEEQFEKAFFRCVHVGFASRRKTLLNNLMAGYHIDREKAKELILSADLVESVRAQELSVKDWERLAERVSKS